LPEADFAVQLYSAPLLQPVLRSLQICFLAIQLILFQGVCIFEHRVLVDQPHVFRLDVALLGRHFLNIADGKIALQIELKVGDASYLEGYRVHIFA